MRPSGTPQELEQRRLRAVRLLSEGFSPVEVASNISEEIGCICPALAIDQCLVHEVLQSKCATFGFTNTVMISDA